VVEATASSGRGRMLQLLVKMMDLRLKGLTGKETGGKRRSEVPLETALLAAAMKWHEATLRLLVEKDVDVNAEDDDGLAALSAAAMGGHEIIMRLLLENGADVEAKGRRGLLAAAIGGHEKVIRLRLDKGVDINAEDNDGLTALSAAAMGGHERVVRLLPGFSIVSKSLV
jgi:ankyrin repeat protein